MASTFTLSRIGRTEIQGTTKVTEWDLDCTSYDNDDSGADGIDLTPAQLGLKRLTRVEAYATENKYLVQWDNSESAPKLTVLQGDNDAVADGPFAEVANATDVGVIRVVAYGK